MAEDDKGRQLDALVGQTTTGAPATSAPPRISPAAPARPPAPEAQRRLVAAVDDYAALFEQAPNDMARGALRPQRAAAICQAIGNLTVQNWMGLIETLSSTSDGKGVLTIRISRRTVLKTWNNNSSDTSNRTLIEMGSPLHQRLSTMRVGQTVVFDGSFISHRDDCLREGSLTINGAMLNPDFVFRFTDVRLLPG